MDLIQWYCGTCSIYGFWNEPPESSPELVAQKVAVAHRELCGYLPSCDGSDVHWSFSRAQPEWEPYPARAARPSKTPEEQRAARERREAKRRARERESQQRERQAEEQVLAAKQREQLWEALRKQAAERLPERREAERIAREYERWEERCRCQEEERRRRAQKRAKRNPKQLAEEEERDRRIRDICARMEGEERQVVRFRNAMAPFERHGLREAVNEHECPYFSEPFTVTSVSLEDELASLPVCRLRRRSSGKRR